jgi:hypothetical protein
MGQIIIPYSAFRHDTSALSKLISIISILLTGKKANQSDPHLRMRDETVKRFSFWRLDVRATEFSGAMADIASMMN